MSTGSSVRITGADVASVRHDELHGQRGASAATDTPGALLASSLLIVLTTMMSGCAATKACAHCRTQTRPAAAYHPLPVPGCRQLDGGPDDVGGVYVTGADGWRGNRRRARR